jgi:uncharacterized repeat protein (TIGR01451 family)
MRECAVPRGSSAGSGPGRRNPEEGREGLSPGSIAGSRRTSGSGASVAALCAVVSLFSAPARAAIFGVPTNLNADGTTSAASADPPGWLVLERQNSGSANGDVVKQIRFFIEVTGPTLDVRVFDAGLSGARDLGNAVNTRYALHSPTGATLGGGTLTIGADTATTEDRLARFACRQSNTPVFQTIDATLNANNRIWGTATGNCAPLAAGVYVFEISIQSNAATEGRNAFGVQFVDSAGTPYNAYTIGNADNTISPPAPTDTSLIVGAVNGDRPVASTSGPVVFYPYVDRGCSVQASNFDLDANSPDGNGSSASMLDALGVTTGLAPSNDNDNATTTVVVEPTGSANYESLNYGMFRLDTVLDDSATPFNHVDWRIADFQGSIAGVPANFPRRPTNPIRTYVPSGYSGCGPSGCAMVAPAEPVLLSSTRVVSGENPPLPGGASTRLLLTSTVYNQSSLPLSNVQITVPIPIGGTYVAGSLTPTIEGTAAACTSAPGAGYQRCTFASLPAGQVASLNVEVDYQPPATGVQLLSASPAAGSPPPNTTLWAQYTPPWSSTTFARTETLGPLCPLAVVAAVAADVHLTKSGPATVTGGGVLTQMIQVQNLTASAAAPNPSFSDPLPAGTTFQSITVPAGWTCLTPSAGSGGTVACSASSSAASSTASFQLSLGVSSLLPNGTVLVNTATATSGAADPNLGNNAATARTTVVAPLAQADLSLTKSDTPDPVNPGLTVVYTMIVTNHGPATALDPGVSDTIPANTTFEALSTAPGWSCSTPAVGGTGTVTCTAPTLATGATATFLLQVRVGSAVPAGTTITNTAQVTNSVADPALGNNSASTTTTVASPSLLCPTPGQDGNPGVLAGAVNTYYPGQTTAASGSTSLVLGPARGGTPIAAGDLVLIIQMQDATIDSSDTDAYGDGVGGDGSASGATSLNGSGLYEYAVATNAVPAGGGTLTLSSGLMNTYTGGATTIPVVSITRPFFSLTATVTTAVPHGLTTGATVVISGANETQFNGTWTVTVTGATTFTYQLPFSFPFPPLQATGTITVTIPGSAGHRYQVVRVPQYATATLGSSLTALPWNGSTGGVLVFDVENNLALGAATVSVSGRGFRGGGARQLTGGGGGSGTAYVSLSTSPYHASKGEGVAGTPRYVYDPTSASVIDTGAEGYPNGSFARGAPGNAGGGGTDSDPAANDENSGGGGGGNGGEGGRGGNAWNSNQSVGGFGGAAVPAGPTRLVLGGGGGAGTRNNSSGDQSSGAAGGGIVLIRAGALTGTGTIQADGSSANVPDTIPANDAGGGGGAGGSVVILAPGGGFAGLTVDARGGRGSDAWPTQPPGAYPGARHGPGGGGGGGVVILSGIPSAAVVTGGTSGTTTNVPETFGAQDGSAGFVVENLDASQIPGIDTNGVCAPAAGIVDLGVAVTGPSAPVEACGNASYTFDVRNDGPDTALGAVVTFPIDANTTFQSVSSPPGWTCNTPIIGGTGTVTCRIPAFAPGAAVSFVLVVRVDCGTPVGTVFQASAAVTSDSIETFPPNNQASQPNTVGPAIQLVTRAAIRGLRVDPASGRIDFTTGWQRDTRAFNVYATDDPSGGSGLDLLTLDPVRAPFPDSTTPILYSVQTRPFTQAFLLIEEIERGGRRRLMGPFPVGDGRLAAIQASLERRLEIAGTVESPEPHGGRARMVPPQRRRYLRALTDPRHAAWPGDEDGADRWASERARSKRRRRWLERPLPAAPGARGARIEVTEAGRVAVTRSQLEAAGMPPGTPLNRLRLYTQGRSLPFDFRREGGEPAVVFSGEPVFTSYSSVGAYVLAWGGVPPAAVPLTREGDPTRPGWTRVERSPIWVANVPPGSDPWLWDILLGDGGPWPYDWWDPTAGDFDLPGLASAPAAPVPVRIRFQGASAHRHVVEAFINGEPVGSVTFDNQEAGYIEGWASNLQPTGNRLTLTYHTEFDDPLGFAYLDYLELRLPGSPALPEATFGVAPYDPTLPDLSSIDFLIVTHPDFRQAASRLAEIRRADGFRVAVVDVERAYDRFSGGFVEAQALHELVRRANARGGLHYVVLLGDDSFDPDDRTGLGVRTFVPSLLGWDDGFGRIASENLYADTSGNGVPDVAIGRLPAQTPEEAERLVTRVADRRALLGGSWGHVLVNDNQAPGEISFRAEADRLAARLPAEVRVDRVDLGMGTARARADLAAALAHGPGYIHYWGHGGPEQLADESLATVEDVPTLPTGPSVLLTWTCLVQFYQYAYGPSLNEAFLLDEAGGVRATFGPSGISSAAVQSILSTRFYDELEGGAVPLGDAIRRAKARALVEDARSRPAVTGFNLLGDPSLLVPGLSYDPTP